ncbi:hypothetical protein [Thermogutta sp.]|uniref:hypothetical protein n=1 Tax=Thermogutta sp. TaxID=1962930 RepID=UPI00321FA1CB
MSARTADRLPVIALIFLLLLGLVRAPIGSGMRYYAPPLVVEGEFQQLVQTYRNYRAQTIRTTGVDRISGSASGCYHLNYIGPGGEGWDLDEVVRGIARHTDCLVVYWQHLGGESCKSISQQFFSAVIKYGITQLFVRVAIKVPGWYLNSQCYNPQTHNPFLGPWCWGNYGIPPGLALSSDWRYVPAEGDTLAGQLYLPELQDCWRNAHVYYQGSNISVAEFMARYPVYVQLYNEVDFEHEWEQPLVIGDEPQFRDRDGDGYKEFTGDYYLLGHLVCSLTNSFSWLTYTPPGNYVTMYPCARGVCFGYNTDQPRIPILIPPVGTGNREQIRQYLSGCLDSFFKLPVPETVLRGANYGVTFGPGTIAYSAHLYAPCGERVYEGVNKITDDLQFLQDVLQQWENGRFPMRVRVIATETGCAQVGAYPNRMEQTRLFEILTQRVLGTPVAWWVAVGQRCHDPFERVSGRNQPEDWDKMAIMDTLGRMCDAGTLDEGGR